MPPLNEYKAARPCMKDDASSEWRTYGEIYSRAAAYAQSLKQAKALVFIYAHNDIPTASAILGALSIGHAVALLDPKLSDEMRTQLAEKYQPDYSIDVRQSLEPVRHSFAAKTELHHDLALLMSTSGSTGSPKFVRLTLAAIEANARSISVSLGIQEQDVAAGHLPLHYSFGFSTLTAHLVKGARIFLTELSFMEKSFWEEMQKAGITHLPGVPFHFQTLQKLRYERLRLQDLKSMAQAGGYLDIAARQIAHKYMSARGGRFYVMYGQTEAAPRMTTLSHDDFLLAPGSVGSAIPGGRLEILAPDPQGNGEVVFHGPNVMMGYAEKRQDLAKGDELYGSLKTGDIGFLDSSCRLTLTGRSDRFGKIYGLRINLDEVEKLANTIRESAVIKKGDLLQIRYVTTGDEIKDEEIKQELVARFSACYTIPYIAYCIISIDAIPRTVRGKIDYKSLEAAL